MLDLRKYKDDDGKLVVELLGSGQVPDTKELRTDPPEFHNFSDQIVAEGLSEGWLTFENPHEIEPTVTVDGEVKRYGGPDHGTRPPEITQNGVVQTGDAIVLHLASGELRYEVLSSPGVWETDDDAPADQQPYEVHHEFRCKVIS